MTTTTRPTLSPADVLALADAIRLIRDDFAGTIHTGTLRHLANSDGDGNHAKWGTDVRDMWVRITMTSGSDRWLRLDDLAGMLATGFAART
jgi:hypothetical protein